jgi:hypothetical protein
LPRATIGRTFSAGTPAAHWQSVDDGGQFGFHRHVTLNLMPMPRRAIRARARHAAEPFHRLRVQRAVYPRVGCAQLQSVGLPRGGWLAECLTPSPGRVSDTQFPAIQQVDDERDEKGRCSGQQEGRKESHGLARSDGHGVRSMWIPAHSCNLSWNVKGCAVL